MVKLKCLFHMEVANQLTALFVGVIWFRLQQCCMCSCNANGERRNLDVTQNRQLTSYIHAHAVLSHRGETQK